MKKMLTSADKAQHLGKANDYLKKSRSSLSKAGDFGKHAVDKDIYEAYEKIEQFIMNACNNLEQF
jgi:cyclopropane fatty-acyl-phospholipid synthase-like methyltransferase